MLPDRPIVMVDGTVPGWQPTERDLHFDHHRPGGALVQILEIPEHTLVPEGAVYVTTQVDADACAAAAYLHLLENAPEAAAEAKDQLVAIAYDCDHLGLPAGKEWDRYREFARNAVASLKLQGDAVIKDFGLPLDRKGWDSELKAAYANECFRRGAQWLVNSALGYWDWPGTKGEAKAYWDRVEALRPYVERCAYLVGDYAVLDQRSLQQYCDPRLLVEWARQQPGHSNVTLTVRDRRLDLPDGRSIPAYSYTLGSVPLHEDGSPMFSDRGVWSALAAAERAKRAKYGYPEPSSDWGGRNEVGGSSWNDACVLEPKEVLEVVTCQG